MFVVKVGGSIEREEMDCQVQTLLPAIQLKMLVPGVSTLDSQNTPIRN